MTDAQDHESTRPPDDFDYSTLEAQRAVEDISAVLLEIRKEYTTGPLARKVALYERTLGLAVIPVLLRRAVLVLGRKIRVGRDGQ